MGKRGAAGLIRGPAFGRICGAVCGLALAFWAAGAAAGCREDQAELRTPAGTAARFSVEIADDPAETARGLMFRERLPRSAGMLFVYPSPQRATFWMHNTLIPLDMIFIDANGTVTGVHPEAVPMDRTKIDGGEGVKAVLEINGGLAEAMGIVPGTVLRHPRINQGVAVWPCPPG